MILDELAAAACLRVAQAKEKISPAVLRKQAEQLPRKMDFPFEKALSGRGIHFICEVKKASPSKGIIAADFSYCRIAAEYEAAGASCISVLTEPTRFLGKDAYLREIRKTVSLPILRKDFTVDEYQIDEAKVMGADAVLLICALLRPEELRRFLARCDELGISALTEAHDEQELAMALDCGARLVGVNNRDLRDFTVDLQNSVRLRHLAPPSVLFVAESGIRTAEDVTVLRQAGVNGVLVGETLMRSPDKKAALAVLRGDGI